MIAIYVRKSLARDGEQVGIENQERAVRELLSRIGWAEDVKVYADNNISASGNKLRPAFEQMKADIESGKVTKIGVYAADRLTRKVAENELIVELAEKHGTEFACVTGQIDISTPMGRAMFRQMGVYARLEQDLKGERQKTAWEGITTSGTWHTGKHTFGYSVDGQVIAEQAAAIRKAYSDLMAGKSQGSVVRTWNDAGFTTVAGKAWVGQTVRRALLNPTIAGLSVYNKKVVGQGQWEAVVSSDEQEALRKRLTDKSRSANRDLTRKHLLSNLLVCECGGKTLATQVAKGSNVYRCTECKRTISRDIANHKVEVWLGWFLGSPGAYEQIQSLMTSGDPERVADINTELDEIAADEKALTESGASVNVILPMATKLQERRAALQSELATLTQTDGLTAIIGKLVEPVRPLAGVRAWMTNSNPTKVRETFSALPLEDRRRVLNSLATFTMLPPPRRGKLTEQAVADRLKIDPLL